MADATMTIERQGATLAAGTPRRRPAGPVLSMAAGLALVGLAAILLVGHAGRRPARPAAGLTAGDVSVVTQVYGPGEESGWHRHSGIHAVAVLSGVLTVYDAGCRPQTFEAGRPYVGGQDAHLVRNEGDVPVVMAVTYISVPDPAGSTQRLPVPAAC